MGKIKIYELAKELDVESKKLMEIATNNGIVVKSHLSSISEEEGKMLKKALKGEGAKKPEKPSSSNENKKAKKEPETPVIIRREIIINEDEQKQKEAERKKKEEQARKNDVEIGRASCRERG